MVGILRLLFLLACLLLIFSPLVADPDLWGHVRFGRDTLLTGLIVRADTYSYLASGQSWINHEWLTEVIYALAYNLAGSGGLIAVNSVLSLSIAVVIYWRLRRAGMRWAGAVLLTVGALWVLRPAVLNVRPQVFTYLLFVLLLVLVDTYTQSDGARPRGLQFILATCVLLVLWVNLHGGVLAGLSILYVWGLARLGEAAVTNPSLSVIAAPRQRAVLLVLLLAPAMLLLNPYGANMVSFLFRTATVARPEILEWHPVRIDDLWSQYYLIAAAITVLAVVFSQRRCRVSLLLPLAVVAALPLSAMRHIPLFAVAAPVLGAEHFAGLRDRLASLVATSWRHHALSGPIQPLFLTVGAIVLTALAAPQLKGIVILPASAGFPVKAVEALKSAGIGGNMATEFNWGEYVIWHLGPGVQVSVDGRRETVYSEAVYRENMDFMRGEGQWDRLVDRPETSLALVDRERPAYQLMRQKAGWALAYEDETAAVFLREGASSRAALSDAVPPAWPADGAGLMFPVE